MSEKFSFTQKNLSDEIGIDVRTMQNYKKLTELIPELEDLVETNIRQRGIGNPNPVKLGRCIKELERIYGIEHGGDRKTSSPKVSDLNQSDIAEMIGISVCDILSCTETVITLYGEYYNRLSSFTTKTI